MMQSTSKSVEQLFREKKESGEKMLSVLIDPDKAQAASLNRLLDEVEDLADVFFIGGSLMTEDALDETLDRLKSRVDKPCILFPGSAIQVSRKADALLMLSLISGRNAELLIGQQVIAAPRIKAFGLETLSVGYMLVDGGRATTASYISQSPPIPSDKPEIAACTALAGSMLGMKHLYLDTGSGAMQHVPPEMIRQVSQSCDLPLIVGGGIRNAEAAHQVAQAGADVLVVGNALEEDPGLALSIKSAIHR